MIKLPNTLQEVFNIVSAHLLTQVKRSMVCLHNDQHESCAYRGKNGMKCAAGILIPDDQYDISMERTAWVSIVDRGTVEDKFAREINQLQIIHDSNIRDDISYLKTALIKFANNHNLTHNIEV
jgi:hypothetical protein